MRRTILVTGSTDGIGLETARRLAALGHRVLLHGRDPAKLRRAERALAAVPAGGAVQGYVADLSRLADAEALAETVAADHPGLDVLINNAGVFHAPEPLTDEGLDVRFVVNTIAPYLLTRRLAERLGASGRVVNVASAAQAPVDPEALAGRRILPDGVAYAQSKLALIMWTRALAAALAGRGPAIVAVNPGSLLATKMVREAFGVAGHDVGKGAEILRRAALDDDFASASGEYFDNDAGRFAPPHRDALDGRRCEEVVAVMDAVLAAAGR